MKVVVLCSGGMDSVAALYWAAQEHTVAAAVSFDYGAKHNHRELPFAAEHAAKLGVRHETIALEFVNRLFASDLLKNGGEIPEGHYAAETMKRTVVPFRNAILLSIACGFAESADVEATIKKVDTANLSLTLDDGKTYQAPEEFNFDGLKAGVKVVIFYTEVDGKRVINDLDIVQ